MTPAQKEIEARAKEKILKEAKYEYALQRQYEYKFALDRRQDIKNKIKSPLHVPFTSAENNLINHVNDLIENCKSLSNKLIKLDNKIRHLSSNVTSAKDGAKRCLENLKSATETFRTVTIPDLMTLEIFDTPQKDRLNDFYSVYTSKEIVRDSYVYNTKSIVNNYQKQYASYSKAVTESEQFKAEVIKFETELIDAENQREDTFKLLQSNMAELKVSLPKLQSIRDAYVDAQNKRQAEIEKELADYDKQIQKDFPDFNFNPR